MAALNPSYQHDEGETIGDATQVPDKITTTVPATTSDVDEARRERRKNGGMLYTIEETPPWYLAVMLGVQHYLTMIGATIAVPLIISPYLCIPPESPARVYLLSTTFFVSGIVTLLQSTIGVRLPIVQGVTFSLLAPTIAVLTTEFTECSTYGNIANMTYEEQAEIWMPRIRAVQGSIAVASIFEMFLGFTGLIGVLTSVITPLVIAPTIALVGLSLFDVAGTKAATNWSIASLTIILMIMFSQYLKDVRIPIPGLKKGIRFFGMFPVLLAIAVSWSVCAIITATVDLAEESSIRTDKAGTIIAASPWVRVPYPGQWGLPTVSTAGVVGMIAGLMASIVESIGDYYACARLAGAPPLPAHALNRGIGIEGFGSILAGLFGTGNGTTSAGENIGAIGLTKVGSRRVLQFGAFTMIVFGCFTKFSAIFVGIPDPVVGGIFCVMFGMVAAVGLSNVQYVDMNSPRNLFVLGFSIFFGLVFPKWAESNPDFFGEGELSTLMQIASVLSTTPMFVGGFLALILDNTIPGTPEERGLLKWKEQLTTNEASDGAPSTCYDLPFGMDTIRRYSFLRKVPFSPTFTGYTVSPRLKKLKILQCFFR